MKNGLISCVRQVSRCLLAASLAVIGFGVLGCYHSTQLADLSADASTDSSLAIDAQTADQLPPVDLIGGLSFVSLPPIIAGPAWAVALGDVNLDGKLDMTIGEVESNPQSISTFLGKGDGTFQSPSYINLEAGAQPLAIVIGDFNGDGKPDYAIDDATDDDVSILLGHRDGTFGTMVDSYTAQEGFGLEDGDLNGDGKLDMVTATMTVLLGKGDGTFAVTIGSGVHMYSVALADLNGDSKLDAVGPSSVGVAMFLGNGDGTFIGTKTLALPGAGDAIAVADLNRDGKQDIVASTSGAVQVFLGQGDGNFGSPVPFKVMTNGDGGLIGAMVDIDDFNGDGLPDIAVLNAAGFGILLGNGTGAFSAPHYFSLQTAPSSVAFAVGDLNGDGLPDIAVTGAGFAEVFLNESR